MINIVTAQKARWGFIIVTFALLLACKKNKSTPEEQDLSVVPETNALQTATTNRDFLTRDSIFLYAKQTYLWNVGMPSYDTFNPRKYSSNNQVIEALKALSSTQKKDKYSFMDDGTVATQLSGTAGDYGFSAQFDANDTLRVKLVYAASPANTANLKRGYAILIVNGRVVSRATQSDVDFLNASIFGSNASISLVLQKPDKTLLEVTINRASYKVNPILASNVFTVGTKKVGYFVFNSFTTNTASGLENLFKSFANEGITELIVDLRYNGGGAVSTASLLTNLIVPASQSGKVMNTTYFNQTMQDGLATILENQKFYATGMDGVSRLYSFLDYSYKPTLAASNQELFTKKGTLSTLNRVYFLVTKATASASELVINNLSPVIDVKLIGSKTYGKPIGFFALRINKSDLYIPQFQTKNSANYGDYFDGLDVNKDVLDDLTKSFGDPTEKMLAQALYYSANNKFTAVTQNNGLSSVNEGVKSKNDQINDQLDHTFKGMVETRKMKFK
ncbi:S41 family peptidase [Pedobacter sp. MW01-1-1]|uniref:S41 family peptidase n=1 Tax=Pedobacter sp. MW01-1-1 TaxID=3383027 RepID=UPI003FEE22F7